MSTYGQLLSKLKIKHRSLLSTSLTPIVDLIFKLLIAVSVTRLTDKPLGVICLFNFAILFYLSFIFHFQPYEDKWEQLILILNAITYLALNYHLFLFTNYVNYNHYPAIASSVIYLVWTNIGVNVILPAPN